MHVYSSSKPGTFKDKKNKIIRPVPPSYDTPVKNLTSNLQTKETSVKKVVIPSINPAEERQVRDLPTNALMKKCFQRPRQIKSIYQLQPLYQTQVLSKSIYKYKASEDKVVRSNSSTLRHKKSFIDKLPTNIFAVQTSLLDLSRKESVDSCRSRQYYSPSKLIKNGIIRYG